MMINRRFSILFLATVVAAHAGDDIRRNAVVIAVEKVAPAVVNIATERIVEYRDHFQDLFSEFFRPYRRFGKQSSLGSGVLIDETGYLVTNHHVVQRASKITVILSDGTQLEGRFVSGSPPNDLALVKITREKPFPYVGFARDEDEFLGETVLAIGNPFGYGNSVSRGIISSKDRTAWDGQGNVVIEGVLQTDAAINPGNSGGPLINVRGELIGVNMAIDARAQNIGFAIPVKRVNELLAEWLTPERRKRVWFGARLHHQKGRILVAEVEAESPAARAGVKAGEEILSVDGSPVVSLVEVLRHLLRKEAGDRVRMGLGGESKREAMVALVAQPRYSGNDLARRKLGLQFQELNDDLVRALGLAAKRGLVVADVEKDGEAWKAGLRRGHVISRIGASDVNSLDDVAQVLEYVPRNVSLTLLVISSSRQGNAIFERVEPVQITTQ